MAIELKIEYCIICDDVRREDTGKMLLIGCYTDRVSVPEYPLKKVVQCFAHGQISDDGPNEKERTIHFGLRVYFGEDRKNICEIEGEIERSQLVDRHPTGAPFSISFDVPLEVTQDGDLSIDYRTNGGEWRPVMSLPIEKTDPPQIF